MKPLIIALVGESGAGKTTLSYALHDRFKIPYVVSYTTRPIRIDEINGRDHWFVPDDVAPKPNDALAYTLFGGYKYWTLPCQIDHEKIISYVIDEKGLIDFKEKWGDRYRVLAIKIERPNNPTDKIRRNRDIDRVPYSKYDMTIVNYGPLDTFINEAADLIIEYLRNHGTERR